MSSNTILCFKCAATCTKENRSFAYLNCKEILCFKCCKINKNNVPAIIKICLNCGKKNVKVTDLSKKVNAEIQDVLRGPQKILESMSFEELMKTTAFKTEQLKIISKANIDKKKKIMKGLKMIDINDKELTKVKFYLELINEKEKNMKMKLKNLMETNEKLKNELNCK